MLQNLTVPLNTYLSLKIGHLSRSSLAVLKAPPSMITETICFAFIAQQHVNFIYRCDKEIWVIHPEIQVQKFISTVPIKQLQVFLNLHKYQKNMWTLVPRQILIYFHWLSTHLTFSEGLNLENLECLNSLNSAYKGNRDRNHQQSFKFYINYCSQNRWPPACGGAVSGWVSNKDVIITIHLNIFITW